jgi:anti-sigma B factor antagonist
VSVSVNLREVDRVSILDLSGRITHGEASGQIREAVLGILDNGSKRIVLNLGDVTYIDSSGLGALVSTYASTSNQGGRVVLLNLQRRVRDLLQITKLYTVFDTYENEADAVRSLQ